MKKRILSIFCCIILLLTLTACGSSADIKQPKFDKKAQASFLSDTLVAENDKYRLDCDTTKYSITLTDLQTGEQWGTSPAQTGEVELNLFGVPKPRDSQIESIFTVRYLEKTSNSEITALSYDATSNGRIVCEPIENGLHFEYYFDTIDIMIPLDIVLYDDYVGLEVDPTKIQEGENQVLQVSLAPYWCSAKNDTEDSYLFFPSGSGALVSTNTVSATGRAYTAPVYSEDFSLEKVSTTTTAQDVLLGVYGVKLGNLASCAIIDKGAETALLTTRAGSSTTGYTTVYSTFQLRGYTNHVAKLFGGKKKDTVIYANQLIDTPVSVRLYPLSGEDANYSGMAKIYRQYLIESYGMTETCEDTPLNLTILGGALTTKSFLGVPYNYLYPVTTLDSASEIINELKDETGLGMTVKLKGFGTAGVDVHNFAGDFKIGKTLGDKTDLKNLISSSKENGTNVYMDFDLVRFKKSSSGFSNYFDSVTNVGEQKAYQYSYDIAVHNTVDKSMYYLLSPSNFVEAATKLYDKTAKFNLPGISLEALTRMTYSDYTNKDDSKFYAKSGLEKTFLKAVDKAVSKDQNFMSTKAVSYAAAISDFISETPVSSANAFIFESDVPFYQMVFKGSVPMSTESVNLSANPQKTVLAAVESGCGLGYTVMENWDISLINSNDSFFYNSVYADIKDSIISDTSRLSDYYAKIGSAHIVSHNILNANVRETKFDNGVTVYVNYGDTAASTPAGEIAPLDYKVLENLP